MEEGRPAKEEEGLFGGGGGGIAVDLTSNNSNKISKIRKITGPKRE